MKVGIVGLSSSGKTTLFRALTRGTVRTEDHGGTANVGVVTVPDRRVDFMAEEYKPKKITHASIEFIDGAARVTTDNGRAHFGSEFFADVRQVDALAHVVRAFEMPGADPPSPIQDLQTLSDELTIADLQIVENRMERLEKQLHGVKKGAVTPATIEAAILERVRERLEAGKAPKLTDFSAEEEKAVRGYEFLTLNPTIAVLNIPEDEITAPSETTREFATHCDAAGIPHVALCAEFEMEAAELSDEEESEFLKSMGIERPGRDVLIPKCYAALGVISFITAGPPEARAWTLKQGSTAQDAAGTVHTDMARGFIRAEVASFADVESAGGWEAAKQQGLMHLQGKDYIVQDGDVICIRFKV